MIFAHRRRPGPDGYLEWKVRLFVSGAALAMAGIGFRSSVLVLLAIAVLAAGGVLRFLPRGEEDTGPEGEEPESLPPASEGDPDPP
jgi:hypothetical protein